MKTKLEIDITEEDIKRGKKEDEKTCPIARATKRAFNNSRKTDPYICPTKMIFTVGTERMFLHLPKKAQRFILMFDQGLKVKPFSFIIRYEK